MKRYDFEDIVNPENGRLLDIVMSEKPTGKYYYVPEVDAERAKDKGYTENLEGARKEDQEYINQLVKERGEWTVEVLVKEKEIKGLKEEIARLNECLKMAGLSAFIKNGKPEEIAEHLGHVAKSYTEEIARLRKALEWYRCNSLNGGEKAIEALEGK